MSRFYSVFEKVAYPILFNLCHSPYREKTCVYINLCHLLYNYFFPRGLFGIWLDLRKIYVSFVLNSILSALIVHFASEAGTAESQYGGQKLKPDKRGKQ